MRVAIVALLAAACSSPAPKETPQNPAVKEAPAESYQKSVDDNARKMLDEGRKVFRFDTFGSEAFFGGQLRLHEVIAGEKHGGIGKGVTPREALGLGLRVDFGSIKAADGKVSIGLPKTANLPELELELESIDFVSNMSQVAPFLVAITVE